MEEELKQALHLIPSLVQMASFYGFLCIYVKRRSEIHLSRTLHLNRVLIKLGQRYFSCQAIEETVLVSWSMDERTYPSI